MRKVWRTKDGVELSVEEMGDSHILNAVRWIERTVVGEAEACQIIAWALAAWKPTPEQMRAIDRSRQRYSVGGDEECARIMPDNYWMLRDEATRRKLWLPPLPAFAKRPSTSEEIQRAKVCTMRLFDFK